jgi:hypothetical protein
MILGKTTLLLAYLGAFAGSLLRRHVDGIECISG